MQYERLLLAGIPFEWCLSRPDQWKKDYFLYKNILNMQENDILNKIKQLKLRG